MQLTSPIEPVFVTDSIARNPDVTRATATSRACARRARRHSPAERRLLALRRRRRRTGAADGHAIRRRRARPHVPDAPAPPAADDAPTPLWTRHTLGAIEADRDRRHARSAQTTVRYRTAPSAPAIPLRRELLAR